MKFGELPDDTPFVLGSTWVYGSASVFIKTLEDGDNHNAVLSTDSSKGMLVPHDAEVLSVEVINKNNRTDDLYNNSGKCIHETYSNFYAGGGEKCKHCSAWFCY